MILHLNSAAFIASRSSTQQIEVLLRKFFYACSTLIVERNKIIISLCKRNKYASKFIFMQI